MKKRPTRQKASAKPQGPLIISISIDQQKLRLYDANGLYAESPISTGMRGHATPMGVFSVIQKQKLHHSNIYSGAPMPFMQRITWSGIAIHAGVLPGYPASHGCIRMPMAFAMKMWNWTKMGARVVVTPGQITPASFSHPLLAALKVAPQPMAADEPKSDAPIAAKAGKAADADVKAQPATVGAAVELRSTIGHGDGAKPSMDEPKASAPSREQTRTADASDTAPAANASVTMSDATPAGDDAQPAAEQSVSVGDSDTSMDDAKPDQIASSDDRPAEAKSSEPAVKVDVSAGEGIKVGQPKVEAKTPDVKAAEVRADAPKADAAKSSDRPDESSKTATAPAAVPPATKDQDRPAGVEKAAALETRSADAASPKRRGQIAVFISRKDSKLYVRQNFAPLFDVPVTIAPSDRPLGTHVFTAQADKNDANVLHWSVVSLPVPPGLPSARRGRARLATGARSRVRSR